LKTETHSPANRPQPNLDPLTGEPGAHPIGTGIGAATAGATGAALGSSVGPFGTALGAVIGAVVGGLIGKGFAEGLDPTAEDAYWREHHSSQSFADKERKYEEYSEAYRSGYTGYREGINFDEREADLRMEYEGGPQKSEAEVDHTSADAAVIPGSIQNNLRTDPLHWDEAREAARAAYDRVAHTRKGQA